RVRRAGPRDPSVLRGDPGPPRAEEPPDALAPPVRRSGRRGAGLLRLRPTAGADRAEPHRERGGRLVSDILESAHEYAVLHRETRFTGPMFSIVTDDVAMPDGHTAKRDFMRHVGAVGVVAIDDEGR